MHPVYFNLLILLVISSIGCYFVPYWSEMSQLLRQQETEQAKSRIVNGFEAKLGDAPWQVSFLDGHQHFCGGAIIGTRTVVTAGHCVEMIMRFRVKYGGINKDQLRRTNQITKVIQHSGYFLSPSTFQIRNDIALVHLKDDVFETPLVRQIKIAETSPNLGTKALLTGWGKIELPKIRNYLELSTTARPSNGPKNTHGDTIMLQSVVLTIMSRLRCNEMRMAYNYPAINERFFCARNPDSSVCNVDSGGPLVANNKLIGIASNGIAECPRGAPNVFTNPVLYRDWIEKNTE